MNSNESQKLQQAVIALKVLYLLRAIVVGVWVGAIVLTSMSFVSGNARATSSDNMLMLSAMSSFLVCQGCVVRARRVRDRRQAALQTKAAVVATTPEDTP